MDASTRESLPPIPLALLVCDLAHRDAGNGKWTLLGLFSVITPLAMPFIHPMFWVYFAFTDIRGRVALRIRLVDANEDREPIVDIGTDFEDDDPLTVHEIAAPIIGARFPEFGEYRLQAFVGGDLLIERRIMVLDPRPEATDA